LSHYSTLHSSLTLSLHGALPILPVGGSGGGGEGRRNREQLHTFGHQPAKEFREADIVANAQPQPAERGIDQDRLQPARLHGARLDRKSTRLYSSHVKISYAVICY